MLFHLLLKLIFRMNDLFMGGMGMSSFTVNNAPINSISTMTSTVIKNGKKISTKT